MFNIKKFERQIRELQRKNDELQQITESMNEALVMLDVNGCVLGTILLRDSFLRSIILVSAAIF